MKKSFAIILSGLLVIGAAGTIIAGSGSKCASNASKCQTVGAAQATPTTDTPAPAVAQNEVGCGSCPATAKSSVMNSGSCPGKMEASGSQTAGITCPKSNCDMKAKAECESKLKSTSATPTVEQTEKKSS